MECNRKVSQTLLLGLCPTLIYVADSQPQLEGTQRRKKNVYSSDTNVLWSPLWKQQGKGFGMQLVFIVLSALEKAANVPLGDC